MSERKSAAKAAPADTRVMYVGPTAIGLGTRNCVYSEMPPQAKAAVEKAPILGRLFIPVRDYPAAERQIRQESGAIWDAWEAAREAVLKGGAA